MFIKAINFVAVGVFIACCLAEPSNRAAAQQFVAEPARPLIVKAIDDADRTVIRGSTHPWIRRAADEGPVDPNAPMKRMLLVLGATAQQERELNRFLGGQHDRASANYHQWLTPEEFAKSFSPSPDDVQKITSWLQGKGFEVHLPAQGGRWIEFSGTAGQVEQAFQTQMRNYRTGGELHLANATDVSLPSALAPVVRGVFSLNSFFSKPLVTSHYMVRRDAQGKLAPASPDFTGTTAGGPVHFLAPGDSASIYDLNPLYQAGLDGSGQTIAIVARSNIEMADVETFREIFNLPVNDPNVIVIGTDTEFFGNGDFVEATFDVEWAGALAPRATIDLVVNSSTATTDGIALSAAYIVDNNLAPIMSVSFTGCEPNLGSGNAFYNALWQQAAAQGISVFVATGDDGSADCDNPGGGAAASGGLAVNGIGSTPFNTAVGGTQFAENGQDATFWTVNNAAGLESAVGYIPEVVWNESCDPTKSTTCPNNAFNLLAGGGGVSTLYSPPSWQQLNIPGLSGANFTHRVLPDVSLTAGSGHDGYLMCLVGSCSTTLDDNVLDQASVVGGTSASSPSMAAIMALIDQKMGGRQGLPNYNLYQIAAGENFANCNSSSQTNPSVRSQCVFNDITGGNNGVPGQTGFNAGTGFDLATGLGSVNAANLATAWSALASRSSSTSLSATSTTTVAHGQPVSFSIGVTPGDGNPGSPSGNVSLISDKFGPTGTAGLISGSFSGSFSSLPGGKYNLVAHYPGDGAFGASDSAAVPVNITAENSSLGITGFTNGAVLAGPIVFGQFLALRGTLTSTSGQGVATGQVSFSDSFNGNTTQLGSAPLNAQGYAELISFGFFNVPINLAVGAHAISASYSGDNSFNSSATSSPLMVTVTKGNSFVTLEAGSSNVSSTEQVLLHIFVGASAGAVAPPTGTVQLLDNNTPVGPAVPVPTPPTGVTPQISFQVLLSPGNHPLTVQYSGDNNYAPGTSATIAVTVGAAAGTPTQTTLTATTTTPVVGQLVNYTVTVTSSSSSPALTGTVQLINDELGPVGLAVPVTKGKAVVPFQWAFGGTQKLLAQYSGDTNFATSASAPITLNVTRAATNISLSASSQNAASGSQISLTASLFVPPIPLVFDGTFPNGMVQFLDSVNGGPSQPLGGPVNLLSNHLGVAIVQGFEAIAVLPVVLGNGNHMITAQFLGDCCFAPATSASVAVTVGQRNATSTTLAADSLQPAPGQTVHFTANVTSPQATPGLTGTVQIVSRPLGILGSGNLVNGSATIPIPWIAGGFQGVFAEYSGDANYASSDSNLVTLTVPTFELFASANALPIPAGQSAAARLTVLPVAGYQAPTSFACGAGIPAGSTCSFTATSVTPSSSPVSSILVIQTTAPSAAPTFTHKARWNGWWKLSLAAGVAGLLLFVLPGRKSRTKAITMLMLLCGLTFAIGCGGNNMTGGPTPTPTPTPAPTPGPGTTTTTLASSATKVASGDTVAFTATVTTTGNSPLTGTVTFLDASTPLAAPVSVSSGQAQLALSALSVGTHSITAHYNGDSQNGASTSPVVNQAVTGAVQFPVTASGGNQSKTIVMNVVIE